MERIINLHIEKLPEGFYLATSDSVQGLVAQGRTIAETIEIAKDVAKKLLEAQDQPVAFTTEGKPLNKATFEATIDEGEEDIKAGKVHSHEQMKAHFKRKMNG